MPMYAKKTGGLSRPPGLCIIWLLSSARVFCMHIELNGEGFVFAGSTALDLLERLGLSARRLAMERNGEVIPRSEYASCLLAEGDRIELVQAIGGG